MTVAVWEVETCECHVTVEVWEVDCRGMGG